MNPHDLLKYWQNEVSIPQAHSEYRGMFIDLLKQLSFISNEHPSQIIIAKYRSKLLLDLSAVCSALLSS